MKAWCLLTACVAMTILMSVSSEVTATAALDTCNQTTGECRARIVTIYSAGNSGYVVLANHRIPNICSSAMWGYYWSLNLTDSVDRVRYATLLTAFTTGQPVELRATEATCRITAVGVGE